MTDYIRNLIELLDQDKLQLFYYNDVYLPDLVEGIRGEKKEKVEKFIVDIIRRYNITKNYIPLFLEESLKLYNIEVQNSLKYRIINKFNIVDQDDDELMNIRSIIVNKQNKQLANIRELETMLKDVKLHPKNIDAKPKTNIKKFYNIVYYNHYLDLTTLKSLFNTLKVNKYINFIRLKINNKEYTKCNNYKSFFEKKMNNESILMYYKVNENFFVELNIKKYTDYYLIMDYELSDDILSKLETANIQFVKNENIYNDMIDGNIELFLPNFTEFKLYRSSLFDPIIEKYIYIDEKDSTRSILKINIDNESVKFYFDPTGRRNSSKITFKVNKIISSYYDISFTIPSSRDLDFFIFMMKYLLTKSLDNTIINDYILDTIDSNYFNPDLSLNVFSTIENYIPELVDSRFYYSSNVLSYESDIIIPYTKIIEGSGFFYYNNKVMYTSTIKQKDNTLILSKFDKNLFSIKTIEDDEDDDGDDEDVIYMLDYRYSGLFFNMKKQINLNKTDSRFKLNYARTCNADKQPIVIDREDLEYWNNSNYSIKILNDFIYACPLGKYPTIYMLEINLPCCGKNKMKPKIEDNLVYNLIKDNYIIDKESTFLGCLMKYLPKKLSKLGNETEIRNYIAKNYVLDIMSQEFYNISSIKKSMTNQKFEFDSIYFYRILEHIMKCNIIILKNKSIEIPNHSNYHARYINEDLPCIFIFKKLKTYYLIRNDITKLPKFKLSKRIKKLYNNYGYLLHYRGKILSNPTMNYDWNKILKNHEIVSQKINSNGRMYCVDVKFIDDESRDHIISIFVPETYPMYVKENNKIHHTTEEICMQLLGTPSLIRASGCFYNLGNFINGVFVPCMTNSDNTELECENYRILELSNEKYNIKKYGDGYNFSILLIKLLLYAKSIEKNVDILIWKNKYISFSKKLDEKIDVVPFDLIKFDTNYKKTSQFIRDLKMQGMFSSFIDGNKFKINEGIYQRFYHNVMNPIFNVSDLIVRDLVYLDFELFHNNNNTNDNDFIEVKSKLEKNIITESLLKIDDEIYSCKSHDTLEKAVLFNLKKLGLTDVIYYFKGYKKGLSSSFTRINVKNITPFYIEVDSVDIFKEDDKLYSTVNNSEVYIGQIKNMINDRVYFYQTIKETICKSVYFKREEKKNELYESMFDKLLNIVRIEYDSKLDITEIISKYNTSQSAYKFIENENNVYVRNLFYRDVYYSLTPIKFL